MNCPLAAAAWASPARQYWSWQARSGLAGAASAASGPGGLAVEAL